MTRLKDLSLRSRIFMSLFFVLFLVVITQTILNPKTHASYDGGRIIDNGIFLDSASMSASDIQNFLAGKGSGLANMNFVIDCDQAGQTAKQAYLSLGAPCGQSRPASHVIYYASQVYGISPKVILVTMQKEQSLTTATNPTSWQLERAMGYGCPTSGGCQGASTFFYQIDNGAWVLRFHYERARGNMNWWYTSTSWTCGSEKNYYKPNLYPYQNVNFYDQDGVYYRTHYIASAATSSLYCYTPHAYNNPQGLYGLPQFGTTGRYYTGSYNFVRFFELWFGYTKADFLWNTTGYKIMNEAKSVQVDPGKLEPGVKYFASITATNIGGSNWSRTGPNPILLGRHDNSVFCANGWIACNRPALLKESSVLPGQTGTFEFYFTAPKIPGDYSEEFTPLAEGLSWFNNHYFGKFSVRVLSPGSFSWNTTGYKIMNEAKSVQVDPGKLEPGVKYFALMQAQNTGTATWKKNNSTPVLLGSSITSKLCANGWIACNRPALLKESSVLPGQTGTFEFYFTAPTTPGQYREVFNAVSEGYIWFNNDPDSLFGIIVQSPGSFIWSMSGYTIKNEAETIIVDPGNLSPNTTYTAFASAKNMGTAIWKNNTPTPIFIGKRDFNSVFCHQSWIACNRPAKLIQTQVAPGQTGDFKFKFKTPSAHGVYRESFEAVSENLTWFSYDPDSLFGVIVR